MNETGTVSRPAYTLQLEEGQLIVRPTGRWNINTVGDVDEALKAELLELGYGPMASQDTGLSVDKVVFDFDDLTRIDTAGAFVLARAIGCRDGYCRNWSMANAKKGEAILMQTAAEATLGLVPPVSQPWYSPLTRLGRAFMNALEEAYNTIVFFGVFVVMVIKVMLSPHRIRWKSVISQIEKVGFDALPIVALLSFFVGSVIAFMGVDLLELMGAKVFVVDLVGIAVLREFGVLITAILLAGRSNSAFTAQIGSMKMRQEIDAMTVIGLDTYETLVAPRALACLIVAPILTFVAMMAGLLGGILVSWSQGISPNLFFTRMTEIVHINHFWVGIGKAPVYGLAIAIIGCRHGLAVEGSVESLGARTTTSVVQAIFTVIMLDAMFALLFLHLGV